jgi:hypothetical protein
MLNRHAVQRFLVEVGHAGDLDARFTATKQLLHEVFVGIAPDGDNDVGSSHSDRLRIDIRQRIDDGPGDLHVEQTGM